MKKLFTVLILLNLIAIAAFAQFEDDDFFFDDGIEEVTSVSASSDLSKGILFENGSVKIGGSLSSSISTMTTLFSSEDKSFSDNLADTTLTPTLNSTLSIDARPVQDLRIYTKFAFNYPFTSVGTASIPNPNPNPPLTVVPVAISDYLNVKECFTDFSVADRAYFRFGIHTVSWGTGFFFSPVSDIINTSSINPEDTDAQVDGCLNLRAQITFPDSLNCLWLYAVPSSDFKANKTAFAAKYEFLLGGWEFGTGAYYKYEAAPKAMITASGSLKKMTIFGEALYQYGGNSEWQADSSWNNKSSIFQATVGVSYYWKDPQITLAAQYYYDGNDVDKLYSIPSILDIPEFYQGHNIAFITNFGKIGDVKDLSISLFGMMNFGRNDVFVTTAGLSQLGAMSLKESDINLPVATFSATANYSVNSALSFGAGPYITVTDWDEKPVVALKLSAKLGGGNY